MRHLLLIAALSAAMSAAVRAEPEVTSMVGDMGDGDSITITGTAFTTCTTAAPFRYDDWSGADVGDTPGEATSSWWTSVINVAATADNMRHSGVTRNMLVSFPADDGTNDGAYFYRDGIDSDYLYLNFWIRWDWAAWAYSYQVKYARFDASHIGYTNPTVPAFAWAYPGTPKWITRWTTRTYDSQCEGQTAGQWEQTMPPPSEDPMWLNVAVQIDQSSMPTAYVDTWITRYTGGAIYHASETCDFTTECEVTSEVMTVCKMGGSVESGGPDFPMYLGEVYLDTKFNRVEVGDNSSYDLCSVREVQPVSAWSATEITISSFRTQSFDTDDTAYMFVVDSSGTPSSGYEFTVGEAIGEGETSAPGIVTFSRDVNDATLSCTAALPTPHHYGFFARVDESDFMVLITASTSFTATIDASYSISARAGAFGVDGSRASQGPRGYDGGS